MIRPARVLHAREKLDESGLDPITLAADLAHIENVNRWLGGWRCAWSAVARSLQRDRTTRILDVGCGSADVPRALSTRAMRRGCTVWLVAADRSLQILDVAQQRTPDNRTIAFVRTDALTLPFADRTFDVVIMSLAFHHFEAEARISVLQEMARVARQQVIINELERCWPNYAGAQLLAATVWRNNAMARHDGPLSVLRSFTRGELLDELQAAGLQDVKVERRFFHRLVASAAPPVRAARDAASTLA